MRSCARPAGRENLEVITRAMALRIVFEGSRAVGVEIARDGQTTTIRARREVLLAAGAYQSPVLLMLSGIGPEDQLAPLGIEVREALPVGHGLQDHCMAQVNYLTDEPSLFMTATPENIALLQEEGRGPLTSNIPEAAGFFRARAGVDAPGRRVPLRAVAVLRRGADRAQRSRLLLRSGGDQADQPRPGDAAQPAA